MMSFLLFNSDPRRILLIGLGGGSLAKFCYRHLPAAQITVTEIAADVIALRDEFRLPSDDERFRVLQSDGVQYIARRGPRKDVILVDACDRYGVAEALNAQEFYTAARRRLAFGGVFVMNICGNAYTRAAHVARIRGVFGDCVITLRIRGHENLIVVAFRKRIGEQTLAALESKARMLQRHFGLNFPRYARKLARAATFGA
jgi:spermidine synthase